jgi:hypothetical protein
MGGEVRNFDKKNKIFERILVCVNSRTFSVFVHVDITVYYYMVLHDLFVFYLTN